MPSGRRRISLARVLSPLALLAAGAALLGCGKTGHERRTSAGGPIPRLAPVAAQGAVSLATRNTTRLGGLDAASDAASVARAVYPGLTPETRPRAVVVVDRANFPAALAASVLAAAPTSAPLLYAAGNSLPEVSRLTLEAIHPLGLSALGDAQVIQIGSSAPLPAGLSRSSVAVTGDAAAAAAAVAEVLLHVSGGTAPRAVIVLPAQAPRALQMPAAGLAAESGAPILFVTAAGVPTATSGVLRTLGRPAIYVMDPTQLAPSTIASLRRYGHVTAIASGEGQGAVANAIAVARYTDGNFGWGVKEPGHGLVFANTARPLDAPAAALLSASGDYGPLLLLDGPGAVAPALAAYLGDIQPAYTSAAQFRPVRGVYNHGWLIGDEQAISAVTQAEIDSQLEISPRKQSSEETPVPAAE